MGWSGFMQAIGMLCTLIQQAGPPSERARGERVRESAEAERREVERGGEGREVLVASGGARYTVK